MPAAAAAAPTSGSSCLPLLHSLLFPKPPIHPTLTNMTVEDKSDTSGPPGETEDDMKARKRKERLEQNRISARESRKRKKSMIEELQVSESCLMNDRK